MDVGEYLERIRYQGPRDASAKTLAAIHRAHMLAVPFENLDIPLGRPIVLSLPALYDKIVRRRRGGFCYELNGLFAWLLERLGFDVGMISARVFDGGSPGPDFDHMALVVCTQGNWIADVGFGDSFSDPLPLTDGVEADQHGSTYRLIASDTRWRIDRRRDAEWEPQYDFSLTLRAIGDFAPMCRHHQTSPDSTFTRKAVCSLATPDGRVTLSSGRLITTTGGRREEREVSEEAEYRRLLKEIFDVDLGEDARIDRILSIGRDRASMS